MEDELSFDDRCAALEETVTRQSIHRELLYKTLVFCQDRHVLHEVEEAITDFPEFEQATQSQYHLIQFLRKADGLTRVYLGEDGEVLDESSFEGLSEDEVDDLIFDEAYQTTEVGLAIVKQHTPHARMVELLEEEPARADTYLELLEYCSDTPRSYKDVQKLLDGREVLDAEVNGSQMHVQPSVFLDKLHRAAAVKYSKADKGWTTTDEGKEFLELKRAGSNGDASSASAAATTSAAQTSASKDEKNDKGENYGA